MFFVPAISRLRAKILNMGISKTGDPFQIKIKVPNPSQIPTASSKALNEDLKDMDVLCTLKIKLYSQNSDHGCGKDQRPYPNKFKVPSPTQEPSAFSKAQNEDFQDLDVLCTFKIKRERQDLECGWSKNWWPYLIKIEMQNPSQAPPSSILQSPKWGLKEHECSLHFQNQDREPKFGTWYVKTSDHI